MKNILFFAVAIVIIGGIIFLRFGSKNSDKNSDKNNDKDIEIIPISHATAVLKWDNTVIYSDPIYGSDKFKSQPSPDIVFVTHEHGDHFDLETLQSVLTPDTTFVLPESVAEKLPEGFPFSPIIMKNGDSVKHGEFTITAVPSYNIREEALERHPKGRDNGYVIKHNGIKVYFSGDSEDTSEMRALYDIDIAFIAMNLPYTMGVESAADAVLEFKPKKVYPYHFRTPEGFSDVKKFKELVNKGDKDIEVILLNWYEEMAGDDAMKAEGDSIKKEDSSMKQENSNKNMEKKEVVVEISGKNFEFNVKEIKVSKGDKVVINFISESGLHDFVVDEFGAATERVNSGEKSSVTFVADKPGKYEYYCSVGKHRANGMVGALIVQ